MSTPTPNMSSSNLPAGVQRAFEHIDLQHPYFPVALYLYREQLMNAVRHHATKMTIVHKEQPNGNFHVTMRCNGDGNADETRINNPSEESGQGTSRYGFGQLMMRLKAAGSSEPWIATWKKKGDLFFQTLSNQNAKVSTQNIKTGATWETEDSHGFSFGFILRREVLGECKNYMIAHTLRELFCMSMTSATLASVHIRVEVLDKEGNPYKEELAPPKLKKNGEPRKQKREARITGIVDSIEENWLSIISILEQNHEGEYPKVTHTLSSQAISEAKYYRLNIPKGKTCAHPFLPTYTAKKAQFALMIQEGFIIDLALTTALDKAHHAASLNGRFVTVEVDRPLDSITLPDESGLSPAEIMRRKEKIRQDSTMTPASSKMTYSGPLYDEVLKLVREQRPKNWDTYIKKGDDSSDTQSVGSSDGDESVKPKPLTKLVKKLVVSEGQQTFPENLQVFSATNSPVPEPAPAVVDVPMAMESVEVPFAQPLVTQVSREALIARVRASLREFLRDARLLTTEELPISLEGLEDWIENGVTYDI